MKYSELFENIKRKKSYLCIGLDTDLSLIPEYLKKYPNPIFEFNKAIIDATYKYTVAYKPNLAFYEAAGSSGWEQLEQTVKYIREKDPSVFIIADAKRGDIGNTARLYASAFFESFNFDAVTLSPYMGKDSIIPFLEYKDKWAIILALTSNESANDFETKSLESGKELFIEVINKGKEWGSIENTMFVVGATQPERVAQIRELCPNHFLLIPGVGAQGGTIKEVSEYGLNSSCGLIINISRSIIYASKMDNFATIAGEKAQEAAIEMSAILQEKNILG